MLPGVLDAWPTVRSGELVSGDDKAVGLEGRIAEIVDQDSFMHIAAEEVSDAFAERAKPCFGTLEDSGGQYCSTLYTDSEEDDLSVEEIKRILHPLNWDICLPHLLSQYGRTVNPTASLPTAGTGSSNPSRPSPTSMC